MIRYLRKIYVTTAILCTAAVCNVYGNYSSEPFVSGDTTSDWNVCGPAEWGMGNSFYDDCSDHIFVRADYLYWQPRQEGLDHLLTNSSRTITSTTTGVDTFVRNTSHNFRFNGRSGWRIGAGYGFWSWGVDVAAFWTHLKGQANASGSHTNGSSSGSSSGIPAVNRGHWKLNYDVVDVLVASPEFGFGSCFLWKVYGGLRLAEIDQAVRARRSTFVSDTTTTTTETTTFTTLDHFRSDFTAAGPELGIKTDWNVGYGFSLYGNIGGALMYGRYKLRATSATTDVEVTPAVATLSTFGFKDTANAHVCQPVLDCAVGIRYVYHLCLCDFNTDFGLQVGWEHHQWFDHGRLGRDGDLTFDGLTVAASFGF